MTSEQPSHATSRTPDQIPVPLVLFIGYSLYMAIMLDAYLTNFGTITGSVGYVSNLPFMGGASAGIGLGAVLVWAMRRRDPQPFSLPAGSALGLLGVGYAIGLALPMPHAALLCIAGVGWGYATTILSATFMEMIAACGSGPSIIIQLASGAFFSGILAMAIENASQASAAPLRLLLLAVCWACARACASRLSAAQPALPSEGKEALRQALKRASAPLVAYVFFDAAIGLVNMYAFAGGPEAIPISSSGPIWGKLVCAGILVAYVFLLDRLPGADFVNFALFPLAIGILLLLPFLGGEAGRRVSVALYAANTFTTTLSMYCLIMACRQTGADVCKLIVIVRVIARIVLLAGLATGWAFARISEGEPGTIRAFMVASTCAYLLIIVLAYWGVHGARQSRRNLAPEQAATVSVHDKVRELSKTYHLTPREGEVYVFLLQGGTAKSIGAKLGVSPYTVQGHIRNLYAKLGVNKKEEAVGIFEHACHEDSKGPEGHRESGHNTK